MASQVKLQLCRQVLEENFLVGSCNASSLAVVACVLPGGGDFYPHTQRVGCTLLEKGRLPLPSLCQLTGLPIKVVKDSLIILIHFGLVSYAESEPPIGSVTGRNIVHYSPEPDAILSRSRIHLYLNIALSGKILTRMGHAFSEEEASLCHKIILVLHSNGRLTFPQLLQAIPNDTTSFSSKKIWSFFNALLSHQFIQRLNPETASKTLVDLLMKEEDEAMTADKEIMTASERTKFRKKFLSKRAMEWDESAQLNDRKRRVVALGVGIGIDDDGANSSTVTSPWNDHDRYALCHDTFHRHFRNADLIRLMERRFTPSAGAVLRVLLDGDVMRSQTCASQQRTTSLSTMILSTKLDPSVTLNVSGGCANRILEYLEAMAGDESGLLSKVDERGGGEWCVNVGAGSLFLKQQFIQSVLQERLGNVAVRLWRILRAKSKLDDVQLAKMAMVTPKIAREYLYQMMKGGFVFLQDVPKTADHSASRTFFLWYVDIPNTSANLHVDLCRTLVRIRTRLAKELAGRAVLLQKANRPDILSGEASLTPQDKANLEVIGKIEHRLRMSLVRLDRLAMMLGQY